MFRELCESQYFAESFLEVIEMKILFDVHIGASRETNQRGSLSQPHNYVDIMCYLCLVADLRSPGVARFWLNSHGFNSLHKMSQILSEH